MKADDWNERYGTGNLPWDTGEADAHLVELVGAGAITPGRALEIGCGTGTNAIWLAAQGFDVHGVDVSARAIEMAHGKRDAAAAKLRLSVLDFLVDDPEGGPFDFVFDRGVFHVFDEAEDRTRFAARVADLLHPEGCWLSLVGSTEGPEREQGPPRRSARDILAAVEPVLELQTLRSTAFFSDRPARAWLMLARPRSVPAQPSTRREP